MCNASERTNQRNRHACLQIKPSGIRCWQLKNWKTYCHWSQFVSFVQSTSPKVPVNLEGLRDFKALPFPDFSAFSLQARRLKLREALHVVMGSNCHKSSVVKIISWWSVWYRRCWKEVLFGLHWLNPFSTWSVKSGVDTYSRFRLKKTEGVLAWLSG